MTARFIVADVFDGLATLEDGSVDLVVTSPPFLALRSYLPADHPDKGKEIGSEPTPAAFLDVLLAVMAELRRVVAPHGSVCVELGDTYAGSGGAGVDYADGLRAGQERFTGSGAKQWQAKYTREQKPGYAYSLPVQHGGDSPNGGKGWPLAKSKTLIPELFRIALAYGFNPLTGSESPAGRWLVRNVVTWCRPNPPVGALGDKWRPATSDVVVACTSPKRFWDDLATRKPHQNGRDLKPVQVTTNHGGNKESRNDHGEAFYNAGNPSGAPLLDYWEIPLLEGEEPTPYGPTQRPDVKVGEQDRSMPELLNHGGHMGTSEHGAPLLDYWEIPPTGYAGAHYAVYPPALVEPLVKAMCPQKVCLVCGEPSRRIVERERLGPQINTAGRNGRMVQETGAPPITLGFTDCGHDAWRPGLILDPFAGSGTTLAVASGHGHDAIGFDLDERNVELARERVGPMFFEVDPE